MLAALSQINWVGILAASLAHFVLGAVWFTVLFGRHYAAALGIADRPPQAPAPLALAGPLVCSAVTIATTALLLRSLGITTYGGALTLGLVVGIGYLATMTVNIAINPLFPHPFRYALVNAPLFVIGSVMACLILVALA